MSPLFRSPLMTLHHTWSETHTNVHYQLETFSAKPLTFTNSSLTHAR